MNIKREHDMPLNVYARATWKYLESIGMAKAFRRSEKRAAMRQRVNMMLFDKIRQRHSQHPK